MILDTKYRKARCHRHNQTRRTRFYCAILGSLLVGLLLVGCGEENTPTPVTPATTTVVATTSAAITAAISPGTVANSTTAASVAATTSTTTASATTTAAIATTANVTTAAATTIAPTTVTRARAFDRVFVIVLENADYSRAIAQPYLAKLAEQGALLTNFFGVSHPSYPNYLAMIAGTTFDIDTDGQTDISKTSLVDLMEAKGISWKSYAQQYPTNPPCFKGVIQGNYVRKHLPFLSFTNIQNNPTRCSKIVPAEQLQKDLAADALPQYVMYVPDQNNDGHDTGVNFAAKWLEGFLTPLMKNPAFTRNTLVVITFDEGDQGTKNQIYTLLLGEPVKIGVRNNTKYNHYSLLRTIEDNFGLGTLGREDDKASPITEVWNTTGTR